MKKFINFCTGFVALTAFIGMTDAGIAKTPIGDFYVPHGEKGDTGLSAYQLWLDSGHTGTVTDFLDSLKGTSIRIKGSVTNCSDLSNLTGLSVGDMYMVTNEGNKVCIYNGTSFPACPDDCDDITGPQGEQGMPGCPSLVTMAVDTDDANCYNITIVNRDYQNGGTTCQNIGTDTKQICNGTPGAPGGTCTHTSVNCGRLGEGTCPEWVNCPNRGATYTTYSGSGCGSLQPTYTCDGEPGGTCVPSPQHCGLTGEDLCPNWVNCSNRGASYVTYSGDACGDLQHSYTCDGAPGGTCTPSTTAHCGVGDEDTCPDWVNCPNRGASYVTYSGDACGSLQHSYTCDGADACAQNIVETGQCEEGGAVTCPSNCIPGGYYAKYSGCDLPDRYTYSCKEGPQGPEGPGACGPTYRTTDRDTNTLCWMKYTQNYKWDADQKECVADGTEQPEQFCDDCPERKRQKPDTEKDETGCVQMQIGTGTHTGTNGACVYTWTDIPDSCDPLGPCEQKITYGTKTGKCTPKFIQNQKRNAATRQCENDGEPEETEECDPEPGQGVCDLSDDEKQLSPEQQTSILTSRIKTRTKGAYTAPTEWVANPGYYTDFGYYTETTAMCQGGAKTTTISDKDTDRCKVLASGGTRTNQNLCADGTLYGCAVPSGETVTPATDGRYLVCIIDSTHKPIAPSCDDVEISYTAPQDSATVSINRGQTSENFMFYAVPGKTTMTTTNKCTNATPVVQETEDSCVEDYGDTEDVTTVSNYGAYTCYICKRSGGSDKGDTYKYCKQNANSTSHKIKNKISQVTTELDGKLTATQLASVDFKPTLSSAVAASGALGDYAKTAEVQTLATAAGQSAGETAANGVFSGVNDKLNKMMYGEDENGEACKGDQGETCTFTSGVQSKLMQALVGVVKGLCVNGSSWNTGKDGCSSVTDTTLQDVIKGDSYTNNDSM